MKRISRMVMAAGVLTAFAADASAQTSVQLSGTVDAFAGVVQMAGSGRIAGVHNGGMTTSQFALKGTEDLGGGLKAGFTLASYLRVDTGSSGRFAGDTLFSQAANISLSGPFGQLYIGRGQAPNYLPTILFNPFGDSFTFSPLVLHANVPLYGARGMYWSPTTPADAGWNNRLLYITPRMQGLTAALFYQFGEIAGDTGKNNYGMNLMYDNGPFAATAFYERAELTNPGESVVFQTGDQKSDWMVGMSWDFHVAKAYATYGRADSDVLDPHAKTVSLGLLVPAGAGRFMAGVARTAVSGGGPTRRTGTIGYSYNLSKRADVYINVMRDAISSLSSGLSWGVGLRNRF